MTESLHKYQLIKAFRKHSTIFGNKRVHPSTTFIANRFPPLVAIGTIRLRIESIRHTNKMEHLKKACSEKEKLNLLLESFQNVFEPGGEATHILEHHINTGNSPPISVPPYRMSHVKKEILRKEIEDLLEKDIIEECESPYGAPVVLIPKPNNQLRLCIDYRKLNEVTVPDTYPLPRMDDLLQEAKHTAYISTIDLKSGYHQVNVNPADRDKTAFVCPFGTYRFKRMPFGLKNAPATFQRLMDIFRRGLPVLAYLDDIIIMSPTFEQHLADLEAVFQRFMVFKLRANREKCQFSCSRVKYLGLWITPQGIEVDHEKTSAILGIPPPKNVKQLQSFMQTCSWYQKFIANFSEIARPLSNLTKKKASWKWSEEEEKAFQTLKECLVSPPILKQADFSKLFLIRTDAITLIEEVLLRYGIPRRLISDNGTQFVSAVMQQICYLLNIHQSLIPVYHPQANPVERKNRDLKPRLAILVQDKHDCWSEKLPIIRLALNTAKCETTGQTATFLNFGRELSSPSEVVNDIRVVIQNDNFVPEITPYLKKFAKFSTQIREVVEEQQDSRKFYADKKRKTAPTYQPGEHVFVASHPLSNAAQGRSAKLMPRRDGPYMILTQRSPSCYEIASLDNPGEPLGVYHTSVLTPCNNDKVKPLIPLRKRGRPPKVPQTPGSSSGRRRNQRGRM
ncbi:retrovirus-related Pol polyprotein from transposon 297 [Trichonephila clavipes]|nr:retrovirus-related Pol polyprotein from transposon 297 [Trichonephila clavipes]